MTGASNVGDSEAEAIEAAAMQHFARGRNGDSADRAEREAWLAADARHAAAYESIRQLWEGLDASRSEPGILAVRESAVAAIGRQRWQMRAVASLAASLLLALGGGAAWMASHSSGRVEPAQAVNDRYYSTPVGQMLSVALSDGSIAILDTDSAIRVHIGSAGARQVALTRGRALFKVAKLAGRPFTVRSDAVAVTAVGTQFDVYHKVEGVDVNLIEGRLHVEEVASPASASPSASKVDMSAGDRLQVRNKNWLLARGAAERTANWAEGQLVFERETVGTIVAELARYTNRKLVVTDPSVGARQMSAIINTDNPLMFLDAIETTHIASVQKVRDGYEIRAFAAHPGNRAQPEASSANVQMQ